MDTFDLGGFSSKKARGSSCMEKMHNYSILAIDDRGVKDKGSEIG